MLPAVPTFSDRPPDDPTVIRVRSSLGVHPFLFKAAYPTLAGQLHLEDVDDYVTFSAPILIDRLVVADRGAAARYYGARGVELESWMPPFTELNASTSWFEPVRQNLASYFGEGERAVGKQIEVTYLVRQNRLGASRFVEDDHKALIDALGKLEREGHKVNIVDDDADWETRMRAIVASTVCWLYSPASTWL
jgi:hypothetical protein